MRKNRKEARKEERKREIRKERKKERTKDVGRFRPVSCMHVGSFLTFAVVMVERLISPSVALFRAKSPGCDQSRVWLGSKDESPVVILYTTKSKSKRNAHPRTGHEGPEGE